MKKTIALALAMGVLALVAPSAARQDPPTGHEHHHSPYAVQEGSGISSLSRREMNDLLTGAGMGLARAAELNQFPGPKHVLELAAELDLTAPQRTQIESVRVAMLDQARRLGEEIVDRERRLDRRFEHRHIDEATLRTETAEIASLYGELRFTHLRAHLEIRALLSSEQIENYDRLRGY